MELKKLPWGYILGGVAVLGVTAYAVTANAQEKPKTEPEPYKPPAVPPAPVPAPLPVPAPVRPVYVAPPVQPPPPPPAPVPPTPSYSSTTTLPGGASITNQYAGPTPDKPIYAYTTMTVDTANDPLNLRSSPNGPVIGSLPKGSKFNVDKIENGWAHGQSASTRQIGWASTQYLGGGTTESTSNNPYGIESFSAGAGRVAHAFGRLLPFHDGLARAAGFLKKGRARHHA